MKTSCFSPEKKTAINKSYSATFYPTLFLKILFRRSLPGCCSFLPLLDAFVSELVNLNASHLSVTLPPSSSGVFTTHFTVNEGGERGLLCPTAVSGLLLVLLVLHKQTNKRLLGANSLPGRGSSDPRASAAPAACRCCDPRGSDRRGRHFSPGPEAPSPREDIRGHARRRAALRGKHAPTHTPTKKRREASCDM